ncbi:hypothetical protein JCM10207_006838 [Rhodosporidiobolus poonsookiae]
MATPPAQEQLTALQSTIHSTLALLKHPQPAPPSPSSPAPPLAHIRNDLVQLAQLVGKEVTNLSLALKPPASLPAVGSTLDKLIDLLAKVKFAAEQLPAQGTLAKRINWTTLSLLESLSSFLLSVPAALSAPRSPPSAAKQARDALLVAAKGVWQAAEQAEQLPRDEAEASRASWKDVLGLLDDCLEEVKDMGEEDEGEAGEGEEGAEGRTGENGEDDDDDDADDDLFPPASFTPPQRARVPATYLLLRLTRLLLHRLFTRTSPTSSPAPPPCFATPDFLSSAETLVQRLAALADDVAAALEPPQHDLPGAVDELCEVADELAAKVEAAAAAAAASAAEGEEEEKEAEEKWKEGERKWVAVWRKQRDDARRALDAI